jgi:hypothetical protein
VKYLAITSLITVLWLGNAVAEPVRMDVEKNANCGCCQNWIDHLEHNGFEVAARNLDGDALYQSKLDKGLTSDLFACHTGTVDGYVIEGHVPADDIARLLLERPDAIGLAVPDMPLGSPGMDFGHDKEPYDVLLVRRDGSTEIFASHH